MNVGFEREVCEGNKRIERGETRGRGLIGQHIVGDRGRGELW